jgi:hypothetical protein
MRPLLLIGALTGFTTGIVLGLLNRTDWPGMLWRSSFAALAIAVLLRWWGQRWTECLRLAQQERYNTALAQRRQREESQTPPVN